MDTLVTVTSEPNGSTISVASSDELTAALEAVRPGQTIALKDGVCIGDQFEATADGTASAPITLTVSRDAILTTPLKCRG